MFGLRKATPDTTWNWRKSKITPEQKEMTLQVPNEVPLKVRQDMTAKMKRVSGVASATVEGTDVEAPFTLRVVFYSQACDVGRRQIQNVFDECMNY